MLRARLELKMYSGSLYFSRFSGDTDYEYCYNNKNNDVNVRVGDGNTTVKGTSKGYG